MAGLSKSKTKELQMLRVKPINNPETLSFSYHILTLLTPSLPVSGKHCCAFCFYFFQTDVFTGHIHETTQNLSFYADILLLSRVSFKFSHLEIWTTATMTRKAGDPGRSSSMNPGTDLAIATSLNQHNLSCTLIFTLVLHPQISSFLSYQSLFCSRNITVPDAENS